MAQNKNRNFGDIPKQYSDYQKAKMVILPAPFDLTSTWVKGADKGPEAIIEASANMELYDIETDSEVYKKGIYTAPAVSGKSPEAMIENVYQKAKKFIQDKKFVVTLGGEHSISIGCIKAFSDFFPKMTVLHLDAHADRRNLYDGSRFNHACVMSRAQEMVDNVISVGIRSMDSSEKKNIKKDKIFFDHQIHKNKNWIKDVVAKLTKEVYLTLDLDVFNPALMPSTGTPEPGGLIWYQVIDLLKEVIKNKKLISFDVVELCPSENKAPDFLAAKLIYQLLSWQFKNN